MRSVLVLLLAFSLQFFSANEAQARRDVPLRFNELLGYSETYEYVVTRQSAAADAQFAGLCIAVRSYFVLSVDVWRSRKGFVVTNGKCEDLSDPILLRPMSDIKTLDANEFGEIDISSVKWGLPRWISLTFGGILFVMTVAILRRRALKSARRKKIGGNISTLGMSILDAMCYAAKQDGVLEHRELEELAEAAAQFSGQRVSLQQVTEMADLLNDTPTEQDFRRLGLGLTKGEKRKIMKSVLYVFMIDGRLDTHEILFMKHLGAALGFSPNEVHDYLITTLR